MRSFPEMASGIKSIAFSRRSLGSAQLKRKNPWPASPKTFSPQAGNSELIVGTRQQVERQAMAGDSQFIADRSHIHKDIKCRMRIEGMKIVDRIQFVVSSTTFSRNFSMTSSRSLESQFKAAAPASCTKGGVHESVVLTILPIEVATSSEANTESQTPATHTIRFTEGVSRNALFHHSGLSQNRMMLSLPDPYDNTVRR